MSIRHDNLDVITREMPVPGLSPETVRDATTCVHRCCPERRTRLALLRLPSLPYPKLDGAL